MYELTLPFTFQKKRLTLGNLSSIFWSAFVLLAFLFLIMPFEIVIVNFEIVIFTKLKSN